MGIPFCEEWGRRDRGNRKGGRDWKERQEAAMSGM